jgi:branched-chain amino acid transport system substrate-binding protein
MTDTLCRRDVLAGAASLAATASLPARAQANPVKMGVLTDESGPYRDSGGPGSVFAAQMAVKDFGADTLLGAPIQIVHADTQNKPDVAGSVARAWYDQGVDAITDLPVTPVALSVVQIAKEKNRTVMITAAAVTDFTAKLCSPGLSHWADDTHALTQATAQTVVKGGGKKWFFITVDYTFGRALENAAKAVIEANGGSYLGSQYFPPGNTDFASQLLQAQASGADVIGCGSVGNDQINLIKQAAEFGLTRANGRQLAAFLVYITDIHALGLPACQGLTFSTGFYWDQSPQARAFGQRFFAERQAMPTKNQASVYLSVLHWLRSAAKAGTRDTVAVGKAMRATDVDYFGHPARVRDDGRVMYDLTLYRAKRPDESHGPWDLYAPAGTLPAEQAFLPMAPACASA